MALPVVVIVAVGPLLGLAAGTYRTALLVSVGWAALYLLLTLDPTLREKIETARSLFGASGMQESKPTQDGKSQP